MHTDTSLHIFRVGQNRINTPYMTVYLVISLPKIPYIHRIYMVLANPTHIEADLHTCTNVVLADSITVSEACAGQNHQNATFKDIAFRALLFVATFLLLQSRHASLLSHVLA